MLSELKSSDIGELATALSKTQAKIRNAQTDKTNSHFRSKYADLSSVWEACRGPLTENGLCVSQCPEWRGEKLILITILMHTSGQWIGGSYPISPEKETPQGFGSALTYARRYSLASMVGVAPDDDDDGNAAMRPHADRLGALQALKPEARGNFDPEMPLIQLAQYICPIGKKFKGIALGKIPIEELQSFVGWLHEQQKKEGKLPSDATCEFLEVAEAFLDKSIHDQTRG